MPFLREDEAPTQSEREKMPEHLFGLPAEKKYPLDSPEHVRAAASYSAKEHEAGRLSDEKFAEIQGHLKTAKKKFGIGEENQDSLDRVQRWDLASGSVGERRRSQQGGLIARTNFTRTGVFKYQMADGSFRRELRHPQDVFDPASVATLKTATLTDDHPELVHPGNYKAVNIGHAADPEPNGKFLSGDAVIQHDGAIAKAESGKLVEASCGYTCSLDPTPGVYEGEPYDARQRNIRYNHVALGPAGWGRAGPEVRMHLDSASAAFSSSSAVGTSDSTDESGSYVRAMPDETPEARAAREAKEAQTRADAAELERLRNENVALKNDKSTLAGQLAGFESRDKDAEKARTAQEQAARTDAQFQQHLTVIKEAGQVLGAKWDYHRQDGTTKSLDEIRREVVRKERPKLTLDGKDEAFVAGVYTTVIADALERGRAGAAAAFATSSHLGSMGFQAGGRMNLDAKRAAGGGKGGNSGDMAQGDDDGDLQEDSVKCAADAMAKRMKDAWKLPKRDRRGRRPDSNVGKGGMGSTNGFSGTNSGDDFSGGYGGGMGGVR
jgi:hypothetical protein